MSFLFGCVVGAALLYAGQKYRRHQEQKAAMARLRAAQEAEPWNDDHFGGTRG